MSPDDDELCEVCGLLSEGLLIIEGRRVCDMEPCRTEGRKKFLPAPKPRPPLTKKDHTARLEPGARVEIRPGAYGFPPGTKGVVKSGYVPGMYFVEVDGAGSLVFYGDEVRPVAQQWLQSDLPYADDRPREVKFVKRNHDPRDDGPWT